MSKIFGFDLGIASIGWAVVEIENKTPDTDLDENNRPSGKIIAAGVRCFNKVVSGKYRRTARSMRRRIRHRAQRMCEIRALLRNENLIDIPEPKSNGHNNFYLDKDTDINVWHLRAVSAFKRALTPREFGRILYHMAKHRGYDDITYPIKLNTDTPRQDTDKKESKDELKTIGAVKTNLTELYKDGTAEQTLCQLLYAKTPHQMPNCKKEITKQKKDGTQTNSEEATYTNSIPRSEIKREAMMIVTAQKKFGNDFFDILNRWEKIAFRQRKFNESSSPLAKSIDKMRGRCIFTNEPVAPKESPTAQLFVALSKCSQNGLNATQIAKVIDALYKQKTGLKYKDVRKLLEYDDAFQFRTLNYKRVYDKETKKWQEPDVNQIEKAQFCAFTGYHKLREYTDNIDDMDRIFEIIATHKTPVNIESKIIKEIKKGNIKICPDYVKQISELTTSEFLRLSVGALKKLIPEMQQGKTYNQACDVNNWDYKTTGASFLDLNDNVPVGYLRKIDWKKLGNRITSPAVKRTLSQLHKVYNAMVRKYDVPDRIHLEIARELKKSPMECARIEKEIEKNEKENEVAKKEYGRHFNKYKLYMEQGCHCMYCGKPLQAGNWDAYEIDHILPYSRSLDNSQSNKVLVCKECNQRKGNKTPYEFMNEKEFYEMGVRARSLNNTAKLKKLTCTDLPNSYDKDSDFIARNANDNAIIARFASQYFTQGIDWPTDKKMHVFVRNGFLTDYLRHQWGLAKNRNESDKHHAQDAIVIACATQDMVKYLSTLSAKFENKYCLIKENGEAWYNTLKTAIAEPWFNFRNDVLNKLESIFVSRPPRCNATGQAHNETIYGRVNSYTSKKDKNNAKNRGAGTINVRFGKAERGDMFRFDIWKQKNGRYTCVPVFVADLVAPDDARFVVPDAEFICTLHKDDYVKLTTRQGESFQGYITQMKLAKIYQYLVIRSHDNPKQEIIKDGKSRFVPILELVNIEQCANIEKFFVTILGNRKQICLPETRYPVVNKK